MQPTIGEERLLRAVGDIAFEDPNAQAIVFVQWRDLKIKIASALREFGIQLLVLDSSIKTHRHVMQVFQPDTQSNMASDTTAGQADAPRVVVISLEDCLSGLHFPAEPRHFHAPIFG